MEVKVNKGTSHPIEILSCGTSSCITIEEAERAMENIRQAINVAKRKSTEFEDAVRDMASDVMGYDFSSEDGLRNCAGQLLRVAYKDLPRWKPVGTFAGRSFVGKTKRQALKKMCDYFDKTKGTDTVVGRLLVKMGWPSLVTVHQKLFVEGE